MVSLIDLQDIDYKKDPIYIRDLIDENYLINFHNFSNLTEHWTETYRRTDKEKSRIIEKILLNIPLKPVNILLRTDGKYEIITGWEDLYTIYEFVNDRFKLDGMDFYPGLNGCTYDTMPHHIQRHLNEKSLLFYVVHGNAYVTENGMKKFIEKLY